MTVAVNMQRNSETAGERPTALFAYAVQVAIIELRTLRNEVGILEHKLDEAENEAG